MRDPETGKIETAPVMTFKEWKEKYNSGQSVIMLTEIGNVAIDSRKFTEYALNPGKAPDKAKAFKLALGYDMSNWQELKS